MLLVVGWDGACWELADRFRAHGRMPVLDALIARGSAFRVASTIPAVTFPAWTSFLTGASPDHHGVTDFTIPRPGLYGVRFANASDRRLPTIFARMSAAGLRVGSYAVPATYPPDDHAVFEIGGFDTPLGASAGDRAAHPPGLATELRRRHGRLGIEGIAQSRIDPDWHGRARRRLVEDIALRTKIALELVAEYGLDVFAVHFMESDTAAHHFWQFDDERSPRHVAGPTDVLANVYAALDRSLGALLQAAGSQADVLVLSDHGSAGASDRILFWNRWLADRGFLAFGRADREPALVRVRRSAMRVVPEQWQARLFHVAGRFADRIESGARFANIDWSRTLLYSDELPYFPSLRVNLAGREPRGTVAPAEKDRLLERVTSDLIAARDPIDGEPVVLGVRRREELFDGPFADRYPDLILELRRPAGYAYAAASRRGGREREWLRRLRRDEASGAKGTSTSGVHAPFGMAVLAGPAACGRSPTMSGGSAVEECTLADLGATALALAGVASPARMQGRSLVAGGGICAGGDDIPLQPAFEYGDDEDEQVRDRLRALGYLP